jgi:phosphoglycerol transferase MdoB-like AlkP superfamily enzyme
MKKICNCFCKTLKSCSWIKVFLIFAAISFIVRSIFLCVSFNEIKPSSLMVLEIYTVGFFFDLVTFCYISILPLIYCTFVPARFFNTSKHQIFLKIFYFVFLFTIVFAAFAEWFFFEEFQTRFNFIAVDYLIYTQEVIANIFESYPMNKLIVLILLISSAVYFFTHKKIIITKDNGFALGIAKILFVAKILIAAFFLVEITKIDKFFSNNYAKEISRNGIYQLFSAYRNNQIDYEQFYITEKNENALTTLRALISKQEMRSKFLNEEDISRLIFATKPEAEKKYNVILISMESLSADFMASFGNQENITPNLDNLAKNGLLFTNMKATGTRTVRGLEALSLSIPPTPGNSIVRRPNNENLFNISSPLKERGYDTKFIYGGFGYFDNMNYFFANNGFEIVDRDNFTKNEITFANAWGVADEDLFDKTIKEADKSYAANKLFLNFVMTTSNHRPFTYPSGKIDIDSKTGRNGAVKYADYAVGKLIEKASKKKWFKNTIFVFVADHCAGSAGNTDLPLWRYQIPAIFYAPSIIKPQVFTENISQIDVAPTLLGMMNLSYKSKFFGVDVLNNKKIHHHAFVSTYSDLGYFKDNKLYVLKPKREVKFFNVIFKKYGWEGSKEELLNEENHEQLQEAISYYQGASYLFKNDKLKNFEDKK